MIVRRQFDSGRGTMSFWQQVKAAGAVAALAAVAACGSTSHSSSPRPNPASNQPAQEPTHSPSVTLTASPSASASGKFRQGYLNAFEDFFLAYATADERADAAIPELRQFATGQALAWAQKQVGDHKKLGVAHAGEWRFRKVGAADVSAASAQVGQCMDWSTWPVVNRTTGARFQQFPQWSQLVYAHMVLIDDHWKAAMVRVEAAAC